MPAEKDTPGSQQKKALSYNTEGGKTKSNAIEIPSISLPKGGGAIKGIDQKFTVNAVNGTAAFSIPLPVSGARGASPSLSISYNSGGGNGIFGLGWNLNLPSIKRKTDKELPQYNDYIDSDTYLLSEAEDLVPEFLRFDGSNDPDNLMDDPDDVGRFVKDSNGKIRYNEKISGSWTIRFYKPRIEGLFARIERWKKDDGEIKWRVISKDNIITLYGWNSDRRSRICDPDNLSHIYEWLPEQVIDDKGNCAIYKYKNEDDEGLDLSLPHNRNRFNGSNITYTNLYLDKVLYGNQTPYSYSFSGTGPSDDDFMFETALDYGQYNGVSPFDVNGLWEFRNDAFSEYKSGFEIRTTRLCKRVLLYHHFPHIVSSIEQNTYLPGGHSLVKSLDLDYDDNGSSGFTFLRSVTSKGYVRYDDSGTLKYSSKSLPSMSFEYEAYGPNTEVREVAAEDLINSPSGLSKGYQFTDLFNEGLSGILSEQGGAWFYKSNFGDGKFGAARMVSPKPSFNGLNGNLQLIDLDGDGLKQMVNFSDSPQGYFEITDHPDETKGAGFQWQPFKRFNNLPNINFKDPNTKLIDLNGDGKTELLITEEQVFTWYESDGKNGFKERYTSPKFFEEEEGPRLVFAENKQTIFLADMSGDGLVDLVRIRNGEVCYWPNLGYGRFGKKVQMDNSPVMDNDADFNPSYVKLADIDGSGTPDLIYLGKNRFLYWRNFSGNTYSTEIEISGFPFIHPGADITVTDLLGTGLSCVVWSSSLQRDASAPLRYIDLMNSKKPHIMTKWKNGLGKEVELEYTPSTKFYIEDKLNGMPWATRLHFPVYCLSKVTTEDKVTGNVFTSTYSYHHGYYDHAEKEFRGFGRVDQTDTEISEHFENDGGTLDDVSLNQAPVLTRSWFHTGAYLRDKKILNQFENEYWYNEYERRTGSAPSQPETMLPGARVIADNLNPANQEYIDAISPIEKRQAFRACKSMPLRTEIFTREGSTAEQYTPFSVSTHNCMIELLQPMGHNKYAIYCVKESEAITYSYERRDTTDPRVAHTLNIAMDTYGNVLERASIVYPRLTPDTSLPSSTQDAQAKCTITFTTSDFTNDVNEDDEYRLRLPSEVKTYEVTKLSKSSPSGTASATNIYDLDDFGSMGAVTEIAYEATPSSSTTNKRLIEHVRTRYYNNNLEDPLPFGELHSKGFIYENYQLAYTENNLSDMLEDIFTKDSITLISGVDMLQGQFLRLDLDSDSIDDGDKEHDWWIRSGVIAYIDTSSETASAAIPRFYTPISYTDQYGSATNITYDSRSLFIEETEDALNNINTVEKFDYRTLTPSEMKDLNDNLSEVILDELGLPKALILKHKNTGSDLADEVNNLTAQTLTTEQGTIEAFFDEANATLTDADISYSGNLQVDAATLLDRATTRFVYDFECYDGSGNFIKPAVAGSILREEHYNIDSGDIRTQISFEYSDGGGQVVMKKVQAEPGEAQYATISGTGITITIVDTTSSSPEGLRWIGNGRTVMNNKGKPIKQYEPFFSTTAGYEDSKEMVEQGITPLLKYDALGRLIRTDFPDGTFTKSEYFGWKQVNYDQNDTVNDSSWYSAITGGSPTELQDAKTKSSAHYNTPKTVHFDTLGRPVTEEETPDGSTKYYTHLAVDIEGNLREVIDARGNTVMQYKYDMLGQMVYQNSMDSGRRWLLHDCMGSPLKTWDERDHQLEFEYDALHRPLTTTLYTLDSSLAVIGTNVVDFYEYGEGLSSDKAKNIRGQLYRHWDTGGLEETAEYYFKGQAKQTERWLASDYKNVVDWTSLPSFPLSPGGPLEDTTSYVIATDYDALGRIKLQTAPDSSIIYPTYSPRGVLFSEDVDQGSGPINHLTSVYYDAKGQRKYVEFVNGVSTNYYYDSKTYRLTRLLTQKAGLPLQDLYYTYDAVGNITWKKDDCIPVQFYNNNFTTADNKYEYDALYRITWASGREHSGNKIFGSTDNWDNSPFLETHAPLDYTTMHSYEQEYSYDEVGNIMQLRHKSPYPGANNKAYTRDYEYAGDSNRLLSTNVSGTPYTYSYDDGTGNDKHGMITEMPHLSLMKWNFKDELCASSSQFVSPGQTPETTWYQYDSKGKRLRKITENFAPSGPGTQKNQRIYIEGYEYYEEFGGGDITHSLSLIDQGNRFVMIENSTNYGLLTRYIHPNHQGSCTLETDTSGDIITYEEYHPFGTTSYQAKNRDINIAAKRYRYTGMERDDETGLNYHTARYYIPWLGRWLSTDPIGIGDGVNVYAYCGNNPVTYIDTGGTQTNLRAASTYQYTPSSSATAATVPPSGGPSLAGSFIKGFATGLATAIAVTAVVAAVVVVAPVVGVALAAAAPYLIAGGTALTVGAGIQNARQKDLFNNPITKEQQAETWGNLAGGLAGGALARPVAGAVGSGLSKAGVKPIPALTPKPKTTAATGGSGSSSSTSADSKKVDATAGSETHDDFARMGTEQPAPVEIENSTTAPKVSSSSGATSAVTVEYQGIQTSIYRSGSSFKLKPGEYTPTPNGKYPARGLSLNADPIAAAEFGPPSRIISIPDELQMIHTPSKRFPGHFDIIPKDPTISEEAFQNLLNKIIFETPHQ